MASIKTITCCFMLLLLFTACPKEPMPDQSLEGTNWVLLKFSIKDGDIEEPDEEHPITLKFTADQASGHTGCNSYFSGYEARSGNLHFTGIGATEKYCEELMSQERQYFNLLRSTTTYIIRPGQLEISSPEGKLLFEKEGSDGQEP